MKAWEIGPRGGVDSLRMVERPDPVAGPGEILVRVTAAGLNYRDLMILRGHYGTDLPENRIPLTDGVGVVEAVGEGAEGFAVGDRVMSRHSDGAFKTLGNCKASACHPLPSFDVHADLPVGHQAVYPPSMVMSCPVVKSETSDAR